MEILEFLIFEAYSKNTFLLRVMISFVGVSHLNCQCCSFSCFEINLMRFKLNCVNYTLINRIAENHNRKERVPENLRQNLLHATTAPVSVVYTYSVDFFYHKNCYLCKRVLTVVQAACYKWTGERR